ncbi:MAG: hypothetical protein JWM12_1388, partial [Ilumatobacteraceae bacterium]|nr:hypothetical protein [Ilumatobacteraceae bacterium]
GSVTVTITVDPDVIPDLDVLLDGLRHELDAIRPQRTSEEQDPFVRRGRM